MPMVGMILAIYFDMDTDECIAAYFDQYHQYVT